MAFNDDSKRPAALNIAPIRSSSSDSSSSTSSLGKPPRTPRFAEATSIHSPIEPAGSGDRNMVAQSQPGDIGFGYINPNPESVAIPMSPRSPLKSAMKVPGTPGRALNPLSPTFREEQVLEKRELSTDEEQKKDFVCTDHEGELREADADSPHRKSRPEYEWQRWHFEASISAAA